MVKRVVTTDTYKVGTGDVSLSLGIGEGQTGASDVFIGRTRIIRAKWTDRAVAHRKGA